MTRPAVIAQRECQSGSRVILLPILRSLVKWSGCLQTSGAGRPGQGAHGVVVLAAIELERAECRLVARGAVVRHTILPMSEHTRPRDISF
jgi:hypothetical protein